MELPEDKEIVEGELATFWFDDSGILCAKAKPTERTLARQKQNYALIRSICNNERVALLCDMSTASAQSREAREYVTAELPKHFKAMALISNSAVGKMIANLALAMKSSSTPIRIFTSETEAKEWLKNFI